jgi:hypothetical protein
VEWVVESENVIATQHDGHSLVEFQLFRHPLPVEYALAVLRHEPNNLVPLVLKAAVLGEGVHT